MNRFYFLASVFIIASAIFAVESVADIEVKESLGKEKNLEIGDAPKTASENRKRNPKLGLSFVTLPGLFPSNNTDNVDPGYNGVPVGNTATATIGTSAILIKGGLLTGLGALKAAIVPPLFLGALAIFLIAGAAFLACSVLDCGRLLGGGDGAYGGTTGFSNFLNRNSFDQYEQQQQQSRPVLQALDDAYKKYQ